MLTSRLSLFKRTAIRIAVASKSNLSSSHRRCSFHSCTEEQVRSPESPLTSKLLNTCILRPSANTATTITTTNSKNKSINNINNSSNLIKMKFHKLACSTAIIATLSSFSRPHVTQAFSPSNYNHHTSTYASVHTSMRHSSTTTPRKQMKLYSSTSTSTSTSTAPVMELEGEAAIDADTEQTNLVESNNMESSSIPKVVATAIMKSFVPSPNGVSGVMAVKLKEEDYVSTNNSSAGDNIGTEPAASASAAPIPKVEGDEQLLSQTGMFGGNSSQQNGNSSSKSNQVEDLTGKTVQFSGGRTGTIIAQRPPMAFVLCDFHSYEGKEDDIEPETISILSRRTSISVNDNLFGSTIDCYGKKCSTDGVEIEQDLDGSSIQRAIFSPIPQIKDIALINSPMLTGTAMIDALAPIGKGQNMLVIGPDSGIGQREAMIGAIKAQVQLQSNGNDEKSSSVKCIYALTTQNQKVKDDVLQLLKDEGISNRVIVVAARDHGDSSGNDDNDGSTDIDGMVNSSAEAIAVAASACSIAEALALANGENTFVVVDDIDKHKAFWDWTTRALVNIYGVDAVVKDDMDGGASSEMRGFYSGLIQRAGRFNLKNGGGSMTLALLTNLEGKLGSGDNDEENLAFSPEDFSGSSEKIRQRIAILVDKGISLTPETLRKIQIPVPVASDSEKKRRLALQHVDDLVSMSDGQIWFDETLHASGQRPAIDPQRSITRVGIGADTPCRADAPAMRGLAGGLRFDFAQAASLEGAGANSGAEKQLLKRESYLLAMHQNPGEVRLLSENCVALLAASLGLLDSTVEAGGTAGTDLGNKTIEDLMDHLWQSSPSAMEEIDQSLDLTSSVRTELEEIIKAYLS